MAITPVVKIYGGPFYGVGGGTAQAQTLPLSPALSAITVGQIFCWLPIAANTAAGPTLAVSNVAPLSITKFGGAPLVAGDLSTTAVAMALYDGSKFQLLNPQSLRAIKCRAYNSVNQSIGTGAATALTFDTNDANITDPMHSTSSNTSRFTPSQAGMYHVDVNISFAGSAAGTERVVNLNKNGSGAQQLGLQIPNSLGNIFSVGTDIYLNGTTDYVEVSVLQDSGAGLNVLGGSSGLYTAVTVYRVP
ncbi:MAG: hypothetical protein KGL39_25515 [Patescibacteria group bacterium]|nr:hypothetical protein [Patescibacteria group bacterium]